MIHTVTLNPSLDRTISVAELHPGELHRARLIREDLAGKGINVSRTLQSLGLPSQIIGLTGGWRGEDLQARLKASGFSVSFVKTGMEIRQNITLLDETNTRYTKINELGPKIGTKQVRALEALIEDVAQPGDLWAFCGSLPPGIPDDLYARLIQKVQAIQGKAFLDTSGAALRIGLKAEPYCIKINTDEGYDLFGSRLDTEIEITRLARQMQKGKTELVVLTRGSEGLVLVKDGQCVIATPPRVEVSSPVGAGDASLAGLIWATCEKCDPQTMARRAVACGTATAMQTGSGMGKPAAIYNLLAEVTVHLV